MWSELSNPPNPQVVKICIILWQIYRAYMHFWWPPNVGIRMAAASGLNLSFQNTLSSSNKKSKWYMYTNIFQNNLSSSNNLSSHFPRLLFIWFKFPTFPSVQSVQSVQSLSLSKSKYQVLEVWRLHWAWLLAGGTGTFSNMNSFC